MSGRQTLRKNDDFAGLAGRLTDELKSHVAALKIVPYRGGGRAERAQRLETIARLSRVALIVEGERELRLAAGAAAAGKELVAGASGGSSLWENSEEVALRYLIEGAKVNLLLRLVEDHADGLLRSRVEDMVDEAEAGGEAPAAAAAAAAPPLPRLPPGLTPWTALERATAVLFPSVWAHREGVQICDHALIGRVLAKCMLVVLALAEQGLPARPALTTLVLRWLGALGGGAALGAAGDKLVAALAAAGVWALLPLFLRAATAAALAAGGASGEAASAVDLLVLNYGSSGAAGEGSSSGGGSGSSGGGGDGSLAAAAARVAPADVLRGAAGAAALMGCESWAATVRPALSREADALVARLAEEAGVVEVEGPGAALLDKARREGAAGGPASAWALRCSHGDTLSALKRELVEGLLAAEGVAGALDGGARPEARGAGAAAGKKLLRPLLDYADWHARTQGKK